MDNTEKIESIDIEQIMAEIREKIKERGYTEDDLKFKETFDAAKASTELFSPGVLRRVVDETNANCHIDYYELPVGKGVERFVKKVVRKMVAFLGVNIVTEINRFNSSATQSINQLVAFTKQYEKDMEEKDKEIEELKRRIKDLEKKG